MTKTPILFIGDTPNGSTGMGMILREIATRAQAHLSDVCDIAAAGLGDNGDNKQPFPVYPFASFDNWKIYELPWIWKQFAGDRKGIILTIANISWLPWFTHPHLLNAANPKDAELRDFLMSGRFEHWAYVPVDSEGPCGRLSDAEEEILKNIPRVLAYTKYGANVIDTTLGNPLGTTEHIPHGTDDAIFYPRDRREARAKMLELIGIKGPFGVPDDLILVGIFATNTFRKDWPLALEVCGKLAQKGYNIGVLVHTNAMRGDWNLNELCLRFGLKGRVIESVQKPGVVMAHEDVAWLYAATDVVLANGSGEGHGSPITEAQACGVPVVHGNYAGGTCHTPKEWLVEPAAWRYEGFHSNKRPVFNVDDWVLKVEEVMIQNNEPRQSFLSQDMMWPNVWPLWESWIRKGLEAL